MNKHSVMKVETITFGYKNLTLSILFLEKGLKLTLSVCVSQRKRERYGGLDWFIRLMAYQPSWVI